MQSSPVSWGRNTWRIPKKACVGGYSLTVWVMLLMLLIIVSVCCCSVSPCCLRCWDELIAVSISCTWPRVCCATVLFKTKRKEQTWDSQALWGLVRGRGSKWDEIGIDQILVNHRLFGVSLNPVSNPLFLNHFPLFQQVTTKLRTECYFLVFRVAIALSVSLRWEWGCKDLHIASRETNDTLAFHVSIAAHVQYVLSHRCWIQAETAPFNHLNKFTNPPNSPTLNKKQNYTQESGFGEKIQCFRVNGRRMRINKIMPGNAVSETSGFVWTGPHFIW